MRMRRILLIGLLVTTWFWTLAFTSILAEEQCNTSDCGSAEECQRRISECQQVISAYTPAQTKNREQLAVLERQVNNTQKLLKAAEVQFKKLEEKVFEREVALEYQKEIFYARVRSLYIRRRRFSPLLLFLVTENANKLTRELSYRLTAASEDRQIILKISGDLSQLMADKKKLEEQRRWLANAKTELEKQANFLRVEVKKVEEYLGQLSGRIAALTAKQQALLAEKTGTFQTTVGEVPLADDPASRPDFNPGFSPAYGAFSFGAPHRKGMSQYGAYGRAKLGQNVEEILRAYYGGGIEIRKDYPTSVNITVRGYGTVDLETYVKRIYEMPNSWGDNGGTEALKAQAVAARSYALAYTNNGAGSICATEHCQVYKPVNKGGSWEAAAEATRGWVLMANGQPFSAWYAASSGGYNFTYTHNGFSTPGGWDTKCGSQGCWTNEAYEKIAASPWFYKGWYKTRQGQTCGRSHPWLNTTEMADILNAVFVYRSGSGTERILPLDYNSCFGGSGNPFSLEEMRQLAQDKGGGFSSISGISVAYGTDGKTAQLVFSTDEGEVTVGGEEFYTVFNLRAPGRISLKSKLFNLEKK